MIQIIIWIFWIPLEFSWIRFSIVTRWCLRLASLRPWMMWCSSGSTVNFPTASAVHGAIHQNYLHHWNLPFCRLVQVNLGQRTTIYGFQHYCFHQNPLFAFWEDYTVWYFQIVLLNLSVIILGRKTFITHSSICEVPSAGAGLGRSLRTKFRALESGRSEQWKGPNTNIWN